MDLKEYFPKEEVKNAEKFLVNFYDKLLLDNKINNTNALIIATYMISNKDKKSMVQKSKVKDLFIRFGRKEKEFSKALYEISGKRKTKSGKREAWIEEKGETIGLNFKGLGQIKKLLNSKEKKKNGS